MLVSRRVMDVVVVVGLRQEKSVIRWPSIPEFMSVEAGLEHKNMCSGFGHEASGLREAAT